MTQTTNWQRFLPLALSMLAMACTETSAPTPDAGIYEYPDATYITDSGTDDAGPAASINVRIANNLPGLTGIESAPGGFDICLWPTIEGYGRIAELREWLTQTTKLPFRGVSPYLSKIIADNGVLDYEIAFYEPAALASAASCPEDPTASDAPPTVLRATISGEDLMDGRSYTGFVSGLLTNTLGATGENLPAICAPDLMSPCTSALGADFNARVFLVEDDLAPPSAGNVKIRFSAMIPNAAPVVFDVCYDPDFTITAMGPMPGTSPETLFSDVAFGTVTDYITHTPMTSGIVYLQTQAPTDEARGCRIYGTEPTSQTQPFPLGPDWPQGMRPSAQALSQVEAGVISTIFASGISVVPGTETPYPALFLMWHDNFTSM